jgi:hypothetical protein
MNPITNDLARLLDDAQKELQWIEGRLGAIEEKRTALLRRKGAQELRVAAIAAIIDRFGLVADDPRMAAHLARCQAEQDQRERDKLAADDAREIPF